MTQYELIKLEHKLIKEENPFGFEKWQQFTKTQVYLKILQSVQN